MDINQVNNGLLIQFGWIYIPGSGYGSITFPISFSNTTYAVTGLLPTYLTDGKYGDYCVTQKTATSMNVDYSNAYAAGNTSWITIGY